MISVSLLLLLFALFRCSRSSEIAQVQYEGLTDTEPCHHSFDERADKLAGFEGVMIGCGLYNEKCSVKGEATQISSLSTMIL